MFCPFIHIKYKCIQKAWERILLARAWYCWALLKSSDISLIGQTRSNAKIAKLNLQTKITNNAKGANTNPLKIMMSKINLVQAENTCSFSYTVHSHQKSSQWNRTCSSDNFVNAFCNSSLKLLRETKIIWLICSWQYLEFFCLSLTSTIPLNLRAES